MKLIICFLLFTVSFVSVAQESLDYIGLWSFKELDRSAMESIDEEKIRLVTNMFQEMKLEILDTEIYQMQFMGEVQESSYTKSGDTLLLDKGDKFILLDDGTARMESGNARLLFAKGDFKNQKTYSYLTEDKYALQSFKTESLLGKWKVQEVKAAEGVEGGGMYEMIGMMITFNFITEEEVALGISGIQTVEEYQIDMDTQELVFIKPDAEENRMYAIIQVFEEYMIVQHLKEKTYLYMVRE
ncbi:hypothetical protein [Nonlabens ulvanivorans]|uniref:Lipocalin-like domain-containing protein n=3 Tax=Nonlabens ulvanivorans TaxID=906888 RepID=A0A084JSR3_NONUL|nr:hypothetical protein [Nonlabens ulvanivorans]KEZ91997.1 hypothetical protein IL45_07535 [Nonlabens ulvanivorans]PRX14824.1 hypothetical protein LY02_00031 [Nonlabens ulvanivorans]